MSKTHWKKLTNPNYLGAYSIEDGRDLEMDAYRAFDKSCGFEAIERL